MAWSLLCKGVVLGIKACLPRWCLEAENRYGETPKQVFSKEHHKLAKEVEEWGNKTATSYSLASVLIVTIMFAALFTVPGGNSDTGTPTLLHRKLFSGFLMCDAVSFVTASASLLGFLNVLTAYRSGGLSFRDLFFTMTLSIYALIISTVTMILAFTFTLVLISEQKWQVPVAIMAYLLALYFECLFFRRVSRVVNLLLLTRERNRLESFETLSNLHSSVSLRVRRRGARDWTGLPLLICLPLVTDCRLPLLTATGPLPLVSAQAFAATRCSGICWSCCCCSLHLAGVAAGAAY
ncbi:hypothetical protein SLEP1_g42677 [Rubroshorea leprosula]|uniref:PGG domain-containing protein n=1 Tax=Rubroshorea leprosula TaxID=152421 RepID=A0AAV5LBL8_9ROSI|nr:hypothetical protein SLEP1_g42677 [Rubroshorea leprosula]